MMKSAEIGGEQMEEKRKYKRLDLEVDLQLERLDEDEITTIKYARVRVNDLSRGGIGFTSKQQLEVHSYYNAKIQIWTKETVDAVIEIIRCQKNPDGGYNYGGVFIGMVDSDALKIQIYELFSNEEEDE